MERSPRTLFILSLPNEILHHIFSCLADLSDDQPFVHYHEDGKDYEVSQMLVPRSVCRRFRAIVADLDFWYDAETSQFLGNSRLCVIIKRNDS